MLLYRTAAYKVQHDLAQEHILEWDQGCIDVGAYGCKLDILPALSASTAGFTIGDLTRGRQRLYYRLFLFLRDI